MGAYLSEPNVETTSEDGSTDCLSYGASAMQGWRVGMEDAHNCITKLAEDTSLFAVYDGHGGAEVAIYTAQQLPKLLTDLELFKNGDHSAALKEAFMLFDASLKQKAIVEKLRRISGMEEDEEKEEDNETETLLEEANLPIEQLVARYCSHPSKSKRVKLKQSHKNDLLSPMIQKKQPRFPLTAVNGTLLDGEGPVPNKTVPFDDEVDVVPKKEADCRDSSNVGSRNGSGSDSKQEKENGIDSDDGEGEEPGGKEAVPSIKKAEPVENGAESAKVIAKSDGDENTLCKEETTGAAVKEELTSKTEEEEPVEMDQSEAGTSGTSGSCNGDTDHRDTEAGGSSSRSSSSIMQHIKILTPASDDEDDDSDEDDADYQSGEDDEEDEDDDDDDDDDDEEDDDEEDRGDYDEEEEDFVSLQPSGREEPGSDSGSTAVVAVLKGKLLTVANIGDSRCVLSRGGTAVDMSYDHKPEDFMELRRIEKAGGKVTQDGRVNGGLNLSRAFGDHCYKLNTSLPPEEQMISAYPDIQTATIDGDVNFMVIACDGIWNAMTSQEVVDFVEERLKQSARSDQPNKLSKICEELFDFCLAPDTSGDGTGCDNMTCIIVEFHRGESGAAVSALVGAKRKSTEDGSSAEAESKKPRH
ncbi:protein phosphatase 1G-like [Diadema antillarum]|uniref:protein phosphatase 1G-like n=1 Tax=Diadema antillarum TaxID=105358 RepID=UPI003A8C57C5